MIQSISVASVATFNPTTPAILNDLRKFNYVFGDNGTGKTTISRVIADSAYSTSCHCTWQGGRPLEAMVLNRDWVENNFDQMRGVFTLGEKQKEIEEKLQAAKQQFDEENQRRSHLKQTLSGDESSGGKRGELAQLESDYRDKFWVPIERIKKAKKLDGALKGVLNDKDKCKQKLLQEAVDNNAEIRNLADLEKRAESILGETPTTHTAYSGINDTALIAHESNPILRKTVIGRKDVDIAAMITKLGNSDWVRQGVPYYEQNDNVCPFCEQITTEQFAQSLKDFFDDAFGQDTAAIDTLIVEYAQDASAVETALAAITAAPGKFLDVQELKSLKVALDKTIAANQLRLEKKKKEPSRIVTLDSAEPTLTAIKTIIDAANAKVMAHNRMVENLVAEKETLRTEVWRYVLNELAADLKQYEVKKGELDRAIAGLEGNIKNAHDRIASIVNVSRELERQVTTIQPTINAINNTLKQFGFDSFALADSGNGKHYNLIRVNGDDAKRTLSEGEKTFVVFLYFYHLLKGSFSDTGLTTDRIVVFDDPVSSLDSDVLFIVSSLIKEACDECRKREAHIKQVFVLTHNVYFHKEVTYNYKRKDKCLSEESFWTLRRNGEHSQCTRHDVNPIKSSYELLWAEVRDAERALQCGGPVNLRIENILRRILEHYFGILGSIDFRDVCEKFDLQDKAMCRSLFAWVNAGSHSAFDDAYVAPSETITKTALRVFKEIFERSRHSAHYAMMNPPPQPSGAAVS